MRATQYNGERPNLDWTPFLLFLYREYDWNLTSPRFRSTYFPIKKVLQGTKTSTTLAR